MTQVMDAPAQGNGNLATRKPATLRDLLESRKQAIAEVLPKHLTAERLIKVAQVAVSRSPLLMKCAPMSILQCVMTSAQLGLDCSGVLGQAYMVPFFNNKTGQHEATLIPGYRGYCELARRSGEIADISADVVYRDDQFSYEKGMDPKLYHKPNIDGEMKDEDIIAAYMVVTLKSGVKKFEVVLRNDIDKIRRSSKASTKGPWVDWFAEMAKKTAIRRGVKTLPMSIELADAVDLDDRYHQGEGMPKFIDAATVEAGSRADALAEKLKTRRAGEQAPPADDDQTPPIDDDSQLPDDEVLADAATRAQQEKHPSDGDYFASWEATMQLVASMAQDANVTPETLNKAVDRYLMSLRKKGKHATTTVEERRAMVTAIREHRFDWDRGTIAAPPEDVPQA